jgi:SAM-dependent methyltransferase
VSHPAADLPPPDESLHAVGPDPRGARGLEQRILLEHWGLTPKSHVLEIGCGIGRLAYELATYLDADGSYAGFDISAPAVGWLKEHYEPRLANFRFDLIDAANPNYQLDGATGADVRFPYADGEFDFACSFGVFMHMKLGDIENYLRELARVLQPDCRGAMTFMVINERDEKPRFAGRDFVAIGDGVYTRWPERKRRSLAYDEALIRAAIDGAGLRIVEAVEGKWRHPLRPAGPHVSGADLFIVAPVARE